MILARSNLWLVIAPSRGDFCKIQRQCNILLVTRYVNSVSEHLNWRKNQSQRQTNVYSWGMMNTLASDSWTWKNIEIQKKRSREIIRQWIQLFYWMGKMALITRETFSHGTCWEESSSSAPQWVSRCLLVFPWVMTTWVSIWTMKKLDSSKFEFNT